MKYFLLLLLIPLSLTVSGQMFHYPYMYSEVHSKFLFSYGYVQYNDGLFSNQALDNRYSIAFNMNGYLIGKKHLYIRSSYASTRAEFNHDVTIKEHLFEKGDNFQLNSFNCGLGYELGLLKSFKFSIYSGILFNEYSIKKEDRKNYYNKTGLNLGADIKWMTELKKESSLFFVVYLNNSLNYSRLNEVHSDFSNGYYAYELGFGFSKKCEPKPSVKRTKRGEKQYNTRRGKFERRKKRRLK